MSYIPFPDIFKAHQKMRGYLAVAKALITKARVLHQHISWDLIVQRLEVYLPEVRSSLGIDSDGYLDGMWYNISHFAHIVEFETYYGWLMADVKASDPLLNTNDIYNELVMGAPIDELNNMETDWDSIDN